MSVDDPVDVQVDLDEETNSLRAVVTERREVEVDDLFQDGELRLWEDDDGWSGFTREVVDVEPRHVVDSDAGKMLTVPEGKGDKYRETPIPEGLAEVVTAAANFGDVDGDDVLVDRTTRSLRTWVIDARDELLEDDRRWRFLTFHDLRRTWAGQLANADVDETVALRWGGWSDLNTFLNHYRGEATAKAQRRERAKVDWI
jgi:integrase